MTDTQFNKTLTVIMESLENGGSIEIPVLKTSILHSLQKNYGERILLELNLSEQIYIVSLINYYC